MSTSHAKNTYYIGLTSFLTDTSTKLIYSVLPVYLLSLGASKTTIAVIEGLAEMTSSILKALSGRFSDKLKKKKFLMVFGYGLSSLVTPIYYFTVTSHQVLILRLLERLGKGIRTAPRDGLLSMSAPSQSVGKHFGLHKVMDNTGAIIGPIIAFVLMFFYNTSLVVIFLIAAVPTFLGLIALIFLVREVETNSSKNARSVHLTKLPRKFYFFLVIVFLFSLGNSTDALLFVKASDLNLDVTYIPLVYMIIHLVSIFLAVPLGRLSDKIGRLRLLIAGYFTYSVTYLMFGAVDEIRAFILILIPYGLYNALTDGNQKSLITDLVKPQLRGTAFGLFHAIIGLTLLPANLIAGTLYDNYGYGVPFYFGSLMSISAAILAIAFSSHLVDTNKVNV